MKKYALEVSCHTVLKIKNSMKSVLKNYSIYISIFFLLFVKCNPKGHMFPYLCKC